MKNHKSNIFRMRFRKAIKLLILLIGGYVCGQENRLILNEIMFNPDGNENTDEFIELYNAGIFTVTLTGWKVSDGEGVDSIILLSANPTVQPGQYVLILDPDYFEDHSTTYDGMIPDNALVVTINNSTFGANNLSNSRAECISLINPRNALVSSYTYTLGNLDGYSEEKILPEAGDSTDNWTNSLRHHGTPGARNSVTPANYDLSISGIYTDPETPQAGDSFTVWCKICNVGRMATSDTLKLVEIKEITFDTLIIRTWLVPEVVPGDSWLFGYRLEMETGDTKQYCGRLSSHDENAENDRRCIIISSATGTNTLLINEIMYAPEPQRSEWIELANATVFTLSFADWSIGDGTSISEENRRLHFPQLTIVPNGYLIVASDSSIFYENVPPSVPILVWKSSTITLNNTGDSLVLYDMDGNVADRVDYRPSWGGGENGHSLERISLNVHSNNALNWAASLDSTGSTPGRINSRTLPESNSHDNVLVLEPNPFSPDGDGHDDLLMIRYNLEHADTRIDMKVFDVRGREVRCLANNSPAANSGHILWDGKGDSGRDLPTGIYIVYLEALGKGGTRIQTAKRPVALARRS